MRAFLVFLLVSSTTLFAAEKTPEEKRAEALYNWRVSVSWERLSPADKIAKADEYVAKHTEVWNQYQVDQLAVMTAACPTSTDCVTADEKNLLAAQVRIAVGLVTAKSKWIKEGKTEAEQKTAEKNFTDCANENKDCDKLPETERNSAREARGSTAVIVTPPATVADDIKAGQDKITAELEAVAKTFNDANPGWQEQDLSQASRDHLVNLLTLKLEKKLEMLAALCTKYPANTEVCLTPEAIAAMRDELTSESCKVDRKLAKKTAVIDTHASQWAGLVAPKSCQALIALDAGSTTPEVETTPVVVEEEDDEKSPRNYKAETCKWVSDLPRKIVNGPSCGKTRSQICTGYVVCEQKVGGGKFIRMSTCGPGKCGATDADAVNCTKDQGYWSKKPASESKLFMSKKLKDILSGAEAQ
jgi:hypothetical protein